MKSIRELLAGDRVLLFDGALGTNLLESGLKPGQSPSVLNVEKPGAVLALQKAYVAAGSNLILTNTFSANRKNFSSAGLRNVIAAGIEIANQAGRGKASVIGDIGPVGELVEPCGDLSFEKAVENYRKLLAVFRQCKVGSVFLETFTSLVELKAAFIAARGHFGDIMVSISLEQNGHTLMGETPESFALLFDRLGAAALGINCTEPDIIAGALKKMRNFTGRPLIAKPNAGRVRITGGRVRRSLSIRSLAAYAGQLVDCGAGIIGGCCGTTAEYIGIIRDLIPAKRRAVAAGKRFALCTARRAVIYEKSGAHVVGERLNPSGRKSLQNCIRHRAYQIYGEEAAAQEGAGAAALDVNAFHAGGDEKVNLERAVFAVSQDSALPLFVDTQNFSAAQAVISKYPGIGVLNSVPARAKELRRWLPMLKSFGFKVVVSLIGRTIPKTVAERLAGVDLTLHVAKKTGFDPADIIFDPLVFALATDPDQAKATLATIRILARKNLRSIIGVSNISFGLPRRRWLNSLMACEAIRCGVDFLILNPGDEAVMNLHCAGRALFSGDARRYAGAITALPGVNENILRENSRSLSAAMPAAGRAATAPSGLIEAVTGGDEPRARTLAKARLDAGEKPADIVDRCIVKGLKIVGDNYEKGIFFIPDLLRSAAAAKGALSVLRTRIAGRNPARVILMATVKGDIHDIGKNIAAMLFESAGYRVIDLGTDVAAGRIVSAVRRYRPQFLGLSALLTTTMDQMEVVIGELRRRRLRTRVIVGGPNVNAAYARRIGAFGAATNALEGLKIVQRAIKE